MSCPECRRLADEAEAWYGRYEERKAGIPDAEAARDAAIDGARQAWKDAMARWRRTYAELRQAEAEATALQAAIDGSGLPPDVSLTPRDGWIEVPLQHGFRAWIADEGARRHIDGIQTYAEASSRLPTANKRVTDATAANDASLRDVADARAGIDRAVDEGNQAVRDAMDATNAALRKHYELLDEVGRCNERCRKAKKAAERIVAAAAALALAAAGWAIAGGPPDGGTRGAGAQETGEIDQIAPDVVAATPSPLSEIRYGVDAEGAGADPGTHTIGDHCAGTDHDPVRPAYDAATDSFVDSPSKEVLAAATTYPEGTLVSVVVDGGGTSVTGTGSVGADGTVTVDVPLSTYGEYTIVAVEVTTPDGATTTQDPGSFGGGFVVDAGETDCDPATLAGVTGTTPTTVTTDTTLAAGGGITPPPTTGTSSGGGTVGGTPPTVGGSTGGDSAPGGTLPGSTGALALIGAGAAAAAAASTKSGLGSGPREGTGGRARTAVGTSEDGIAPVDGQSTATTGGDHDRLPTGPEPASTVGDPAPADGIAPITGRTVTDLPAGGTTKPRIRIETGGAGDSLHSDQPFRVIVELPPTDDPPETITVDLSADSGDDETWTLAWTGNVVGPPRYESTVATLREGAEGGGTFSVAGFAWSTGGFDSVWFDNGERITIGYGGTEVSITGYTTHVQQGLAEAETVIRTHERFWSELRRRLVGLEDLPEAQTLLRTADDAAELAKWATRCMAVESLPDHQKLARMSVYADFLARLRPGTSLRDSLFSINTQIRNNSEAARMRILDDFTRDLAIGMYRTVVEATPAASAWTLFTGRDILDRAVTWDRRVLAALDLASWVSLAKGSDVATVADALAGTGERRLVTRTGERLSRAEEAAPAPRSLPRIDEDAFEIPGGGTAPPPRLPDGTYRLPAPQPLPGTRTGPPPHPDLGDLSGGPTVARPPDPGSIPPPPPPPPPLPGSIGPPPRPPMGVERWVDATRLKGKIGRVRRLPGVHDVYTHGSRGGTVHLHDGRAYDIETLARQVEATPGWKTIGRDASGAVTVTRKPVRLVTCHSGSSGVAADLARRLHTKVLAPSTTVWLDDAGGLFFKDPNAYWILYDAAGAATHIKTQAGAWIPIGGR